MDLNRDKKPDLVLEGNESYCTSFALFLNQGGFHSFSPDNFISVYTTSEDERFLLDLDQDGNKELLVRAGLFGRVGAAEIPMGCDEILDKTDAAVREEFLKRVEEPYLDEKGNKPKWVPVAFLPTEKIKILGFDPKNKMKLVDQTSHYQKDIQWRLGVLEKILASPESFVTDRPFTPECRKKIEGTVQYLKGLTEAGESLSKKAPN